MQSATAELARNALDAAPDAMIILDADGIVRLANRQVATLFGYEHEQIIGKSVELFIPERFRSRHEGYRRAFVRAPQIRPMGQSLALFGRRRDGSEFPVEISLSPVRDGDRTLVAAAIRDASERKRVEAELRRAQESSDRARQAKGRFLATASHDLRQPLQSLALLNGALRRIVRDSDAVEVLAQQEQAIGAMSRLLNAFLDISKLESGAIKPEISDFRVSTLLEGLQREFASLAASKGLNLHFEGTDDFLHSDPSLIEQIIKNLLSNAIKYTLHGRVQVRALREGAAVRIDVQDTGIGIPPDQLAYIYDEFYQVGVPANSSRNGYGLGLSIVQRLVKLLDLRLEVVSDVGRGSVFSLFVPSPHRTLVEDPPAAAAGVAAPQTGAPLVLLVEDDPGVRGATRMLLKVEGYRVQAVESLSEAIRVVDEQGAPDLLVTDYHLAKGKFGTEVIATLRARLGTALKAVLMTGDTSATIGQFPPDPNLRIASKPVNAEQLLTLLSGLLAQ